MNDQRMLFDEIPADICFSRHRGSVESTLSNPSVLAKREAHERIIELLREKPLTALEISEKLGVLIHKVSGRCSELRLILKIIEKTGIRRDNSAELKLI